MDNIDSERVAHCTIGARLFLRPDGSKPAELERLTFGRLPVAFQRAFPSLVYYP